MAARSPNHGKMDISKNRQTWNGFTGVTVWSSALCIFILLAMYLTLVR